MRSRLSIVAAFLALTLTTPSYGTLAFYEGFDYPVGNIPAPWTNDETSIRVREDGLTYTGLATSGNNIYGNADSFHNRASLADSDIGDLWNTTGSFYMTYLVNREKPSTTFYVWHELSLRPNGGGSYGGSPHFRMWVPWRDDDYEGRPGLDTVFEIAGESESDSVEINPFGIGTKGVALKFTMDTTPGADDMLQIVLNPASFANEPNWAEADYTLTADITASSKDKNVDTVNLHARNWNECNWDEIRIGDTWADVISGGGGGILPGGGGSLQHNWAGPSGNYNDVANWRPVGIPAGNVKFGNNGNGNTTAFTDGPISVSNVSISGDTASYALAGFGPVNLDANTDGGGAVVSVSSGSHQIQAPVSANVDATVDVADGSSLNIVGALSLNGTSLTKEGDGTLSINSLSSGGGTIVANAGTVAGNGMVGDLVNVGGTISPGNAISSVSTVPEPTTGVLVGMGILLLGIWGERRRK